MAAHMAVNQEADLVELRLDHLPRLPGPDELAWCDEIRVPVIATIRKVSDGGVYDGSEPERLECLRGAAASCDYVDLELQAASAGLVADLKKRGAGTIISHHDFRSTPPQQELLSLLSRARATGGAVCKIATLANSSSDVLRLLSLPQVMRPTVVVAMGEKGRIGRVLAPLFGSEFAYASPEGTTPVAPGMLTLGQMRRAYLALDEVVRGGRPG
jgi:3-dehydroquinate dehydratase type I